MDDSEFLYFIGLRMLCLSHLFFPLTLQILIFVPFFNVLVRQVEYRFGFVLRSWIYLPPGALTRLPIGPLPPFAILIVIYDSLLLDNILFSSSLNLWLLFRMAR